MCDHTVFPQNILLLISDFKTCDHTVLPQNILHLFSDFKSCDHTKHIQKNQYICLHNSTK
ncbi:unnamed protein product [Arabidopsis halleri]